MHFVTSGVSARMCFRFVFLKILKKRFHAISKNFFFFQAHEFDIYDIGLNLYKSEPYIYNVRVQNHHVEIYAKCYLNAFQNE